MTTTHTTCTPTGTNATAPAPHTATRPDPRLALRRGASAFPDRPTPSTHKDRPAPNVRQREDLFDAVRLSRRISGVPLDGPAGIVAFPTSVIAGAQVADIATSVQPGLLAPGVHRAAARVVVGDLVVTGEFDVVVGDRGTAAPAVWSAHRVDGRAATVPAEIEAQLPTSTHVRAVSGAALRGAVRRAHLTAEQARARLIETNRGLVRTVVNRYRTVVRTEATSLDMDDLMLVGEHQMLDTADRFFTDPDLRPVRDVAWSKLVQRAVGNAVRSEIARATGISVEFRQLLSWFHAHPEDRSLGADVIAQRMATSAGVTRLMAQRGIASRATAHELLREMLATGRAVYVAPGRDAAATARDLRADGVFVITPRSSLAEIDRARTFQGAHSLTLDETVGDGEGESRGDRIGRADHRFDEADATDAIRRTIVQSGMSPVEALVWLHRTGALDPTGQGVELPEIADELGLDGRAEARAALRRARRKLDTWMVSSTATDLRTLAS